MVSIRRIAFAATITLASAVASPAFAEKTPLKVVSGGAVKGAEKLVIGAFTVGFIFESVDNDTATGGLVGAFGSTTRAKSELVGVTSEMMQAITDAAYDNFRSQLTAKGFAVGDSAGLFASPKVAALKPVEAPYVVSIQLDPKKNSKGKATFMKPTALPGMLLLPGDIANSGMFGAMGQIGAGISSQMAVNEHARASGETVIDVVYLIDFSQLKRPGAFSFGGLEVNSGMAIVPSYSRLSAIAPSSKIAQIMLQTPVAVEGDFASRKDETKDAAVQSVANIAGGVAAAFGYGGLAFGKSRTFVFTAKPAWQEGATKAASLANDMLAGQLAALR